MIEMQQLLVADRIALLDDEAAALRAERRYGRAGRTGRVAAAARIRVGHWLVVLGTAVAGRTPAAEDGTSLPHAA